MRNFNKTNASNYCFTTLDRAAVFLEFKTFNKSKGQNQRIAFAIDLSFLCLALVGLHHITTEHSLNVYNAEVQHQKYSVSSLLFFLSLIWVF